MGNSQARKLDSKFKEAEPLSYINSRIEGKSSVIELGGDLNFEITELARKIVVPHIQRPDSVDVVFDIEDVSFIDTATLGLFVGALKRAREFDKVVRFGNAKDRNILKVFEITGLNRVFTFDPTLVLAEDLEK